MDRKKTIIITLFIECLVLTNCKSKKQFNVNIPSRDTIVSMYANGMFKEVLPYALEYNKVYTNDTIVSIMIADSYYEIGDYEKAKNEYSLALTLNYISKSDYYSALGNIARRTKNYKNAFAFFDSALIYNPSNYEILLTKALTYSDIGLNSNAIETSQKLIQLDSNYVSEALTNIGLVYMDMKQFDSSLYYFKEAYKRERSSIVCFNIATAYRLSQNNDSAFAYYDKAIEYSPNTPFFIFERGNAYYNIGEVHKACSDWKKSVDLGYEKAQQRMNEYCH